MTVPILNVLRSSFENGSETPSSLPPFLQEEERMAGFKILCLLNTFYKLAREPLYVQKVLMVKSHCILNAVERSWGNSASKVLCHVSMRT